MRNALIISLCLHFVVGLVTMRIIRIRQVRFVPREVYAVRLVSLEDTTQPKPQLTLPKEVEPEPPLPEIKETKQEELVPPTKKPKPKKKPEPKKKEVPSTRIEKKPMETADADTTTTADVATGDMALDVEDFPFAYYLTTIKRKIAANWRVPGTAQGGEVHCRVYFVINKSGAIDTPVIETSSGNFLFDQAALRAVVQASPLPPLPGGFADDYLGVHFSFAYEEE
ncbi:MAG: TonB C-terminal domain-containing protein [Candidatus Latescibacterota bacterium]|nr:MAG: TonB C-terminal domain-containing protein [Candidatus Latescibacterota bacterium]